MKASRVVWHGVKLRKEPLRIEHVTRNSKGNEISSIYNDEYLEVRTFYT